MGARDGDPARPRIVLASPRASPVGAIFARLSDAPNSSLILPIIATLSKLKRYVPLMSLAMSLVFSRMSPVFPRPNTTGPISIVTRTYDAPDGSEGVEFYKQANRGTG